MDVSIDQTCVLSAAKPLHLLMCCAATNSSFSKEVLVVSFANVSRKRQTFSSHLLYLSVLLFPLPSQFTCAACLRTAQEQTFTPFFLFTMLERHGCVKAGLTVEIRSRAGRNSVSVDKDVKGSDTVSVGPASTDMTSHHVTQ